MDYRILPDGSKISTIGIGVGNYVEAKVTPEEIGKIFQTAFEHGVNFFDTCMSASAPSQAVAKAIDGKRSRLIMQNHLCVSYPDGNYRPAGIDIGAVNRYFDLAKVGDQLAARHYKGLSQNASDCIGCGACVERCPFHVDAKNRMEEIVRFFSKIK